MGLETIDQTQPPEVDDFFVSWNDLKLKKYYLYSFQL